MKKILVLMVLFCLLQLNFVGALPGAKAVDLGMHITSPGSGVTITATTFQVSGTFDVAPPINNFKLFVTVGTETHTYNFTASGLTWGPVTVNMADFPHMSSGNSYTATLQAVTAGPTLPPCQTDPLKIFWSIGGSSFKIIASSYSGGLISPSGTITVNPGDSKTFTITPNQGHKIADVKVDGSSVGIKSTYTFTNITSNHTIEATFEMNTYTIDASSEDGGSITPQGTITVNYGESKTFQIMPQQGYEIKDVLVDGKTVGAVASYLFTNITSNHLIQVTFVKKSISTTIVLQIGNPNMKINGKYKSIDDQGTTPVIKNDRTLVPIRAIVEALGGTIAWDGTERKVTITLKNTTIELWIGKNTAQVNGINTLIDSTNAMVVPEIINSRTMLPIRFVSESLGAKVDWDGATQTITIIFSQG